jgi:tetratricopeptide (TPR) repeat protein
MIHFSEEDIEEAYETVLKIYPRATSNFGIVMRLLWYASLLDYNDEAYKHAMQLIEILDSFNMSMINDWHRIGYALLKAGDHEKADYYFNEQIRWCEESIRLDRPYAGFYGAHYDLAAVLAFRGDSERALELLNEVKSNKLIPKWWITQFKYDPLLDPIRDDVRFQKILDEIQITFQKEHDRVKYWMESQSGRISP